MKTIDLTGVQFGKLTVLRLASRGSAENHYRNTWLCKCSCGVITEKKTIHLRSGQTTSCGCTLRLHGSNSRRWAGFGELSGRQWSLIRQNAKRRGLPFKLTMKYAWDLFEQQGRKCALTGEPIELQRGTSPFTASLDRIDSDIGYIEGNVQWVHTDINIMKGVLSEARFCKLCEMVVSNRKR